jgi:hypothetical protein
MAFGDAESRRRRLRDFGVAVRREVRLVGVQVDPTARRRAIRRSARQALLHLLARNLAAAVEADHDAIASMQLHDGAAARFLMQVVDVLRDELMHAAMRLELASARCAAFGRARSKRGQPRYERAQ